MTFVLGYLAGVVCTLVFLAWWMGLDRKTPGEQARDDAEQMAALWPGYEEHA